MYKMYYFSLGFLILSPGCHDESIIHRNTDNLIDTLSFQVISGIYIARQMCLNNTFNIIK